MNTVSVDLGDRSYDINIGSGLLSTLGTMIQECSPSSKYFFVLDDNIESTHAIAALQSFETETCTCSVHAIESNKTMACVQEIWSSMLTHGCDRQSPIVAIGGGIVGDVGGFASATFMRGVPLIQVPTTLLAMVDAAIGGKTGVNIPITRADGSEVLGKNLAGSFWQPRLVVADVDTLCSLDDRHLRSGLAECVKHAMLGHDSFLKFIQERVNDIFARDAETLIELVSQSAAIKAGMVSQDERESGCRAFLNLGHTFAHAIEPLPELSLCHGEAVSIGLCAAVSCAEATGLIEADMADQTRNVLQNLGLPTRLPVPIHVEELLQMMKADKKSHDSAIRLVLPTQGGTAVLETVDEASISLAWLSVGAFT